MYSSLVHVANASKLTFAISIGMLPPLSNFACSIWEAYFSGTYMAISWSIRVECCGYFTDICSNVGSIYRHVVGHIYAMQQAYCFGSIWQ